MTKNSAVTERLAQWLCDESYDRLPAQVRQKASDVLFDAIGGMVACSTLPEVKMIVEFLREQGGKPECTVIGHDLTTSVTNAAMAIGGMGHGDEVDAIHTTSAGGHVAAGMVAAALAVGEQVNASGKEVIRAIALGYEVGGRMITIFYRERDYFTRRYLHSALIGNLSSAVTAGILLGLDREAMQAALCLGTYQAAGPDNMTKEPAHVGKTFQIAAANRNGVTAALLARRGCRALPDILEGKNGFFDTYLGKPEVSAEMLQDLGRYYSITDVMYKQYSAGAPNQTYLQGLFRLLQENHIAPEEIAQIEIQIPQRGVHRVPTSRHASISGLAVCAIAATTGKLDFYRLHDPASAIDAAVVSMQQRIRFVGREDWTGMEQGRHAIVNIRTRDDRTFEEDVWHQPMSRADLERKFHDLVEPQFGVERTQRLQRMLGKVETADSIRPLMQELRG